MHVAVEDPSGLGLLVAHVCAAAGGVQAGACVNDEGEVV